MKETKSEAEQEMSMYAICFTTLVISALLLFLIEVDSPDKITGFIVFNSTSEKKPVDYPLPVVKPQNISYENISQENALNAILQAENDMKELQEQGFGIRWINDTLLEAKKYFEGANYTTLLEELEKINDTETKERARILVATAQEKIGVPVDYKQVLEKTAAIAERKAKTYELSDLIRSSELRIEEFKQEGLNTSEADVILANAVNEFKNERYEDVENLLATIDTKLIELSAETTMMKTIYRAGKVNIIAFFENHYKELLLLLGSLSVIALLLYNRIMIVILRRKIKDLKVEEDVLEELMKRTQADYFARANIPRHIFEVKIAKFKERLAEVKQTLPVMESLLDKRLKSKRVL